MSFNILIVAQAGRLQYEALVFLASLRAQSPGFQGKVYVAVPQAGPNWDTDPTIKSPDVLNLMADFDATIIPFENKYFGQSYPYGNKIEALLALPKGEPFVFFDTDTLITGEISDVPFDFDRPTASKRVEATWPELQLYGPRYSETWGSLYRKFGYDFESSLDLSQPDEYWRRYLYFNAGYFFYRCPHEFGQRFLDIAVAIRDTPPPELVCQTLHPWLDQIALPLVIHSLGGGRDTLPDGYLDRETSCHYRVFPLLYARESDHVVNVLETTLAPNRIKKVVKEYMPIRKMVFQKKGHRVRDMFDQNNLPKREQQLRNQIKRTGLWMR